MSRTCARSAGYQCQHIHPWDPANRRCGTAAYVCHGGTSYSTWSGKFNGSTGDSHFPYAAQSDAFAYANGAHGAAIEMFSPEQLPVKSEIAKQFGVFNKLYSSVPSASTPNHLCEHHCHPFLPLFPPACSHTAHSLTTAHACSYAVGHFLWRRRQHLVVAVWRPERYLSPDDGLRLPLSRE